MILGRAWARIIHLALLAGQHLRRPIRAHSNGSSIKINKQWRVEQATLMWTCPVAGRVALGIRSRPCATSSGSVRPGPRRGRRERPRAGNASSRPLRELTPDLSNTFRRCHSTVRALMKSSAPISGLVRPSRPLGDVLLLWCEIVQGVDVSLADLFAGGQQLSTGSVGEAVGAFEANASYARCSWSRASDRRCSRRSHSPNSRRVPATSNRSRVGFSRSIACA